MAVRRPNTDVGEDPWLTGAIEQSMIRYRYGPWAPAYYALLGARTRQEGSDKPFTTASLSANFRNRRGGSAPILVDRNPPLRRSHPAPIPTHASAGPYPKERMMLS